MKGKLIGRQIVEIHEKLDLKPSWHFAYDGKCLTSLWSELSVVALELEDRSIGCQFKEPKF